MNNKLIISTINKKGKIESGTFAAVTTRHLDNYYSTWYESIYDQDVSPCIPDQIIPSIAALYEDNKSSTTSTARRDRGTLRGWASLNYDYGNPAQNIQGSRIYSEYSTEFLSSGHTKHKYVFKFNPNQCNGKINKLRIYGNPSGQCNLDNVNGLMDYTLLTKIRPYLFNSCHTGILMPSNSASFGVNSPNYNMNWNPDDLLYRAVKKSLCRNDAEFIALQSVTENESRYIKTDLRGPNVTSLMPMPDTPVSRWNLPISSTSTSYSFAYHLTSRGYFYAAAKNSVISLYKVTSNSSSNMRKVADLKLPKVEYANHHSDQFNLFIQERDLYCVFRIVTNGDFKTVVVRYDLERFNIKSYKEFPSWPWLINSTYSINDFFILPDGNFAVSTIQYGESRNRPHASCYIVYDNNVNLTTNTNPEECAWIASLKTSITSDIDIDPLSPDVLYGQSPDFYYGNNKNHMSINGVAAETLRYDTNKKAFCMYNKYGGIGWAPMQYCGPEMILAEIDIPAFVKSSNEVLRVEFEYNMRITSRTKPSIK